MKLDLVGCHGQTLYHQARAESYAGRSFACTWQAGEALRLRRASAFRWFRIFARRICWRADRARRWFRCSITCCLQIAKRGRVLQNIGGIANLTAIPAGAGADVLIAFDTGPGNMVIDWLAQKLFGKKFDRNGAIAARGTVLAQVLESGCCAIPTLR